MMASTESSSCAAFDGHDVALGVGVAEHVDRVADAGGGGQLLAQRRGRAAAERGRPSCRDSSTASAAMMPGPPALVMIATRLPLGSGCMAKAVA